MINYITSLKQSRVACCSVLAFLFLSSYCFPQAGSPKEDDFFKIMRISAPEGVILEVGGLVTLPNGSLGVTTRRGDVFIVENPTSLKPRFVKFASGLHEVLGLAYKNGSLYCVQRGELTKMTDTDNDGLADDFETIYAWPLSGNYHEYSFGPKLAADGSFFVTLNLGFPPTWWNPESMVPWRGWALHIFEDGRVEPWAAGMRSPCGISMIDDQLFYTENQGDWVGSGSIMQVKKGGFMGHPSSLVWSELPNSPVKLTSEKFFALNETKMMYDEKGNSVKPENDVNEKVVTETDMKKNFPSLQVPAVWLPHGILGVSNSEIVKIPEGTFGPFAGQMLVGDQGQSMLSRVFMEKINGEYQGAAWPFRSGFQSGIVRLAWMPDGSLAAGETNRGWGSAGEATEGLQRLVWNGKIPFEMLSIKAMPDGFEIRFTQPVDRNSAMDLASYTVGSFIYKYHSVYGSPPVNNQKCMVKGVKVSEDGLTARMIVEGLRPGYIHDITLSGLKSKVSQFSLLHPTAYYTLNSIPGGKTLAMTEVSTKNSALKDSSVPAAQKVMDASAKKGGAKTPTYEEVKGILTSNTCLACHSADKRQVGPAFKDVAAKKYTVEELVSLIYTPKPEHWPEFSTPMPPMTNVPRDQVIKIATWINSLNKK